MFIFFIYFVHDYLIFLVIFNVLFFNSCLFAACLYADINGLLSVKSLMNCAISLHSLFLCLLVSVFRALNCTDPEFICSCLSLYL